MQSTGAQSARGECKDAERNSRRMWGHRTRGHREWSVCTRVQTARTRASHQQGYQLQTLAKLPLFRGAKEQRWASSACVSKISPTAVEWQREPGISYTSSSTKLFYRMHIFHNSQTEFWMSKVAKAVGLCPFSGWISWQCPLSKGNKLRWADVRCKKCLS